MSGSVQSALRGYSTFLRSSDGRPALLGLDAGVLSEVESFLKDPHGWRAARA